MYVHVRARRLPLTNALEEYVERRIRFALGRFTLRISGVIIRLSDTNGPRGGSDKRCSVNIVLRAPRSVLILEETGADLYATIDRAADRTARSVNRRLEKERDLHGERERSSTR